MARSARAAPARPHATPMQIAYLHVVINHLPIMAVPVLAGVLALGLWTRSGAVQRAALLGLVVVGVLTVAVYLTGHGAKDFVEHLPEVGDDDVIDAHESAATVAFALVSVLALAAAAAFAASGGVRWLVRRGSDGEDAAPVRGAGLVLVGALVASIALGITGRLGGKITHTEFRTGADAFDPEAAEDRAKAAREHAEDLREEAADAAEDAADDAEDAADDARDAAEDAEDEAADRRRKARRD